jgi:hypothetical protein
MIGAEKENDYSMRKNMRALVYVAYLTEEKFKLKRA